MITCPTCGAQNDPENRFCDQCGTRLASAEQPAAATVSPDQPTVAASTCPSCGATVLPGEAFCDSCGAALDAPAAAPAAEPVAPATTDNGQATPPAVMPDAPTMMVSPPTPAPAGGTFACPVCGHQNLPGDQFCDNCGADLTSSPTAVPSAAVQPDDATVIAPRPEEPAPEPAPVPSGPDDATVIAPPPPPPPQPDDATVVAAVEAAPPPPPPPPPPQPDDATVIAPVGPGVPAEPAIPATAEPAAPAATAEERTRLEGLVTAHRETVAQYEQMLSRYPAGSAPAFLTAGLDAARAELAQAEANLAALPSGPDPAEVQRLEGLVTAHRETVAQYEQMLSRYPAGSAPAFLTAGLDAARAELAQAEAELTALVGHSVPTTPAPTPVAPATPAPASARPGDTTVPVPPSAPAPAGPRLVIVDGGHELKLPTGKDEIIIGREDPVSNIFPEIDLTPYGGESGGVSRQHARINHAGGQWTVTDLNSTNYTRVDGNRLEPNTPTPIHDGARLQFGRIVTVFHL